MSEEASYYGAVKYIEKAMIAAGELAKEMSADFGAVETKLHEQDVVTEADKAVNKFLVQYIQDIYPDDKIISEEMGVTGNDSDCVWIIDPIDGTLNYSKGVPCYAVLVSMQYQGETTMGFIYDPINGDMYSAEKGEGAKLNGRPIKCSRQTSLHNSAGITFDAVNPLRLKFFENLLRTDPELRIRSSAYDCTGINSAYTASGRRDWYLGNGDGKIWDYAGTMLIMRESGCKVTNLTGDDWQQDDGPFLAANPILHEQLLKLL